MVVVRQNLLKRKFIRKLSVLSGAIVFCCSAITMTHGQIQNRQALQGLISQIDHNASSSTAMFIEPTAPIMNLFARAEEGILRRDWKFAIDSLQRIIDNPESSLMPSDKPVEGEAILYVSVRRKAIQQIASLPPQGLRAYRLLFDGKAKGYFERAKADHDPELLRLIVSRYLLSRFGDDAADLLASWALDDGRANEARTILEDVIQLVPDADVPIQYMISKLAMAYKLLGMNLKAASILADLAGQTDENDTIPKWFDDLAKLTLASAQPSVNELDTTDWFVFGGSPQRHGRMPEVTPTLIDSTPWRYDMPGSSGYSWRKKSDSNHNKPDDLPVIHAVSSGNRIFIRKPSGCVALDADELRVLWEFPPASRASSILLGNTSIPSMTFARWNADVAFIDYVIGSISVTDDQVFTVELDGKGTIPGQAAVAGQQPIPQGRPFRGNRGRNDSAMRLVAYDANTGELQWHRGRTYDPNDALGDVQFRSLPIEYNGSLWLSYVDRADYYLGVLDPADGSLVKQILLGSYRDIPFTREPALQPALSEGMFYVPTNLGLLFAVDAKSYEVRWASQYRIHKVSSAPFNTRQQRNRRLTSRNQSFIMKSWLTTPPVVSGGSILLAARDTDELQAFSTLDGHLRWSVTVDNQYYIIAADDRFVWLGGRGISCHSLTDGAIVWKYDVEAVPTGRAVLSGDTIHIPTSDGMTTLDAHHGKVIRNEMFSGIQSPLGNLLCLNSSMYSVDPTGVRLFPDLDRIYTQVLSEHQNNKDNIDVALRLAWVQLLRDEPKLAYQSLQEIAEEVIDEDSWQAESIAHVRVAALQKIAILPTTTPGRALELLTEASQTAKTPRDQLDVSLAIAHHRGEMNDHVGAYEILYQLGLKRGESILVSQQDHVEIGLRFDLARRMKNIMKKMKPSQRKKLAADISDQFEQACLELSDPKHAVRSRKFLSAMSDLGVVGGIGSLSLLKLADWELKHRRYERAEQLLLDCVRQDQDTQSTIASLMKMFELYSTDEVAMVHEASLVLNHLESRFSQAWLPADILKKLGWLDSLSINKGEIGDWVIRARDQLDMKIKELGQSLEKTDLISLDVDSAEAWILAPKKPPKGERLLPFEVTGDLLQSLTVGNNADPPRIIHFDHDTQNVLGGRVIFRSRGDILYCQQADTGSLLWQTTLQLPQTFEHTINPRTKYQTNFFRHATSDSQIAVFNGRTGIFAIGLLTGRRLWAIPYDLPSELGHGASRDRTISASDGFVAAMPHAGRLSMIRLRDGFKIWERNLRGEIVADISMSQEVVYTVDHPMQRVHLFNRKDGRLIQRVRFQQPDTKGVLVDLIESDGVLCGPDQEEQTEMVKGIELTSGKELWRFEVDKPLAQIFEPQDGYIGIGLLGGDVYVLRAKTGEVLLEHRIPNVHAVIDGDMVDATFIVKSAIKQQRRPLYEIVAIDIPTGAEIWRRKGLVTTMSGEHRSMMFGRTIPAIIEYQDSKVKRQSRLSVVMIDSRTGANIEDSIDMMSTLSGTRLNGDFVVLPGAAIMGTNKQIKAFRTEPVDRVRGNDF